MTKHIFSVLIFILIFLFILFVVTTYVSNNNKKKIKNNRTSIYSKIEKNLLNLPLIKNDTNNVIEFNSGYTDKSKKKDRNFWDLFKND